VRSAAMPMNAMSDGSIRAPWSAPTPRTLPGSRRSRATGAFPR
jgi:hypothetical protein